MSAGLVAVTVTPGSTAPVLSVTVPLIRPRKSCARVGAAIASSVTHRQNTVSLFSLIDRSSNGYENNNRMDSDSRRVPETQYKGRRKGGIPEDGTPSVGALQGKGRAGLFSFLDHSTGPDSPESGPVAALTVRPRRLQQNA